MKTVYKYLVPVDDRTHRIPGTIVHVASDGYTPDEVIVWSEVWPTRLGLQADVDQGGLYQVFGTGHPVPEQALHRGTVLVGPFVWHLYQLREDDRV